MARPWRIEFADAVYHVTARGNDRRDIFLEDGDREDFLFLLGQSVERFGLEIFAFCLMSNHYHLFLRTPGANLSRAFQWINTAYAVKFNYKHHRGGHLFGGRYKSVLVADEAHWLHLSMYLHLNPVRAGMVDDPAGYVWSSYHDYVSHKPRFEWLMREEILSQYGQGRARFLNYQKDCLGVIGKEPAIFKTISKSAILGSREAIDKIVKLYRPSGKTHDLTDYKRLSQPQMPIPTQLHKIAKCFGVSVDALSRRHRNFPPRLAAYLHLVRNCGMKASQVAEFFRVNQSSVTRGAARLEQMANKDPRLKNLINSLKH